MISNSIRIHLRQKIAGNSNCIYSRADGISRWWGLRPPPVQGKKRKAQWTAKMLTKRWLLWFGWCVLTVTFSAVAILYQVCKSIPGSLPSGEVWSLGLKACIGTIQATIGIAIIPWLARNRREKKVYHYTQDDDRTDLVTLEFMSVTPVL